MRRTRVVSGALLVLVACERTPAVSEKAPPVSATSGAAAGVSDSAFSAIPDSAWVSVEGPTLVAFYPIASNDSLDADEELAGALGDLSYHVGSAMDSLVAAGFKVEFRGGDTLWFRTRSRRERVVRDADSGSVGYVFIDTTGRRARLYGVRTNLDLVAYAREFRRTGAVRAP